MNALRRETFCLITLFFIAAAGGMAEIEASTQSAHDLVNESIQTMGHKRDMRQLRSLQMSTNTVIRDIVENEHTGEPYTLRTVTATVTDDLLDDASLTESKTAGANGEPALVTRDLTRGEAEQIEVSKAGKVQQEIAYLSSPAWEIRNPFRALLLADRAADLQRENDISFHDSPQHVVSFQYDTFRVWLYIDSRNKLPTATESTIAYRHSFSSDIAWNALGDLRERTEFMLWDIVDGMRYPTQWDTYRDDVLLQTVVVNAVHTNVSVPAEELSLMPDSESEVVRLKSTDINNIALGEAIKGAPNPKKPIEEIAPGIVQIPGSWYTTLVRQEDGIVVIDAPISSGYSKRVLEEAERRFPGVPIKAVITSTSFFWHIAGVREYAARHIPIYLRDANRSTVERILNSPHTLVSDELSAHPVKPIIHAVSDRTVIGHGKNAVVVMPIWLGFEPMVMTYIPDAHILHTGEMIQPLGPNGALLYPESLLEIRDTVLKEKLQVDRLIGMHMSPTPWSVLEAAIRDAGA
jgi:hypothetical protein